MRDRPLLRLSRLLSMDSHPSLPRPSVCGSLEPTTLLMKPVAWFSTCVFPSRGVICAFSQQCSPYSDVFCPTRSMALLTFPLFLPLLPLACYQGERTCLSFSARLLSSRCASRGHQVPAPTQPSLLRVPSFRREQVLPQRWRLNSHQPIW